MPVHFPDVKAYGAKVALAFAGAAYIPSPEEVDRWLSNALTVTNGVPERMDRMIASLNGLSGSDLGVAVMERAGGGDPYTSMRAILGRKLLKEMPQAANAAMQTARIMEPDIRRALLEKYSDVGCVQDVESLALLKSCRDSQQGLSVGKTRPWLRDFSGDLLILGGRRYLVEYKAMLRPGAVTDVPTRTIYKMHHARRVLADHGIEVEPTMLVAKRHINEEGFFELTVLDCPFDPVKEAALLDAGDHFWELRNRGELPPLPPPLMPVEQMPSKVRELADRFAAFDAIASQAYRRAQLVKEELGKALGEVGLFEPGTITIGAVSVKVDRELDRDRACQLVGLDFGTRPADGVLIQKLQEADVQLRSVAKNTFSIGISRQSNGLAEEMREMARAAIPDVYSSLLAVAQQDAAGSVAPNVPVRSASRSSSPACQ